MNRPTQKEGSALLVTLMVMGLMLVTVLAFSVYVRLELRAVRDRINQHRAQQNARLAMHLALNKLQMAAGPDRRVTARAEILGSGVVNEAQFWTGVWGADGAGGVLDNPIWLVSGNASQPTVDPDDPFVIFPAVNTVFPVEVPRESLRNASGQVEGEFAYWVADEGVKASVNGRRDAIRLYERAGMNRARAEYQVAFGVNLDTFFQAPTVNLRTTILGDWLKRISFADEFPLGRDSVGNSLLPLEADPAYHDMTTLSLGVLENTRDGGLKKNLSDPDFRDGFLATDHTWKFLSPKDGTLRVEYGLPADEGVSDGEPFFSPRPILTEAVLYIGMYHTRSDARLRMRYHVEGEFLNPYSLPLEFPRDGDSSYNRGLVLVFDNLPTVRVRDESGVGATVTENLNRFSSYPSNNWRYDTNSWFDISGNSTGDSNIPYLHPGETYQVMEPNPATQPRGLARYLGSTTWAVTHGTRPADDAWIEITADHPSGGVEIRAVPYRYWSGEGPTPSVYRLRKPMQVVSGLDFDDFVVRKRFYTGPNPFSRQFSSDYIKDDYFIAYHFRLFSDETDSGSMRDIAAGLDLQNPQLDASGTYEDVEGNTRQVNDLMDPISTDPRLIVQDDFNLFSKLDQLKDETSRSHIRDYREMMLIDVPTGIRLSNVRENGVMVSEVPVATSLSVGALEPLSIVGERPRSIGNPWGGEYNAAFDRYYLSPKIPDPDGGSGWIPLNPALALMESTTESADEDDAEIEMVNGRFNINSTSVPAWESLLSSPILTPRASDEAGGGFVKRSGAFFRMPEYQAGNPNDFVVDAENLVDPDHVFAQGVRMLIGSDGQSQIRQMAENVVTKLKQRGEPFPDMRSFLNAGILQESIDEVMSPPINTDLHNGEDVFEFSNVYLTQADLVRKMSPVAGTRSDTFTIRAYGTINAPGGETLSRALCEAVVQRLPEKLDGSDPHTPALAVTDMRRFEIVTFRWLTDAAD